MINFSTLQGLTIPEGVVTQITDESGRVIWAVANDKPIVLEVEKITSDTYAGETTYTGEQFILLNIYPKTASSKVKVTYGGLTKTLAFSGTNAQKVFFGTFNGVSDSVATAASGELTIEGDCIAVGCAPYIKSSKGELTYAGCITGVNNWGALKEIWPNMFYMCYGLSKLDIPTAITRIGSGAFTDCTGLTDLTIPENVVFIGSSAFKGCKGLVNITILAENPPTIDTTSFNNTTCTFTVKSGYGETYKTTGNWTTYADRIVEAS